MSDNTEATELIEKMRRQGAMKTDGLDQRVLILHLQSSLREAAEMLSVTDCGYRMVCQKNDELQALCGKLTAALNEIASGLSVRDPYEVANEAIKM